MLKYYGSSYAFTAFALIAGFLIGGWPTTFIVLVLGILEVSLSFDNAVVNASVLKNWGEVWRRRFIVWGIPIAVFGMRLVFPLVIVGVAAGIGMWDALKLAMSDPKQYEVILTSVHHEIAAFGGAFLMLVFLNFFIDSEKEHHWLGKPEECLSMLAAVPYVSYVLTMLVVGATAYGLPLAETQSFLLAGVAGVATYWLVQLLGTALGGEEDDATGSRIVKEGIGGFLYLEVLDASFSFDGVIAAFALTNQIFVIMLGLAVGAMFVRSMTLHLVSTNALATFKWLEHSAFWAIGVLAVIMFAGVFTHISELVVGLSSALLISAGVGHSVWLNKQRSPCHLT